MTLIDHFITNVYTVTRNGPGSYQGGLYTHGPSETVLIRGSLQPNHSRSLKQPEEGDRIHQTYDFYSDQPLLTDSTKTLASSDRVIVDGENYRVMDSERWIGFHIDLPYFRSTLVREPEQ